MSNPFRPTFGASPLNWAGRRVILDEFSEAINGQPGNPTRSLVIDGARGIGKTVLLTELEDIAAQHGWIVLRAIGNQEMVRTLVDSVIPAKINELAPPATRKVTGVSISGLGEIKTDFTSAETPVPTLISRLRQLLALLKGTGILITVDEVQDADQDNLSQIAVAYQDLIRDDLEVSLAMAGLTPGINRLLDLPGTTFLRRARRFELGPLTDDDARATLIATAEDSGRPFEDSGADLAVNIARGYPYLVQLIGYLAWNRSHGSITAKDVAAIDSEAIATMGAQIHAPSTKGLPAGQLAYLRAMADLMCEQEPYQHEVSSTAVAEAIGKRPHTATDTRGKLLDRGLIQAPGWGKVSFTLPYLAEFLRGDNRVTKIS